MRLYAAQDTTRPTRLWDVVVRDLHLRRNECRLVRAVSAFHAQQLLQDERETRVLRITRH